MAKAKKTLMIYGANGYSGELIARAAKARGLDVILAGRNAEAIAKLGAELDFATRCFDLSDDLAAIDLHGVDVLLHCAGPFSKTAMPMLQACLRQRVHYLDITGEIEVFQCAHELDQQAKAAKIVLCPGVGFDVVPTDCLALLLKQKLPQAKQLVLAFYAQGGMSRGTALTSIEGLGQGGGRARVEGKLQTVPPAWKVRDFEFANKLTRSAMTIPWGDVYTAYVTSGIPNIEVYMAQPKSYIRLAKAARWFKPILANKTVQSLLQWPIRRGAPGPDADRRARSRTYVYGEASNGSQKVAARLKLPNGYDVTIDAALLIAMRLLEGKTLAKSGYQTPSLLCGADTVLQLQNAELEWLVD